MKLTQQQIDMNTDLWMGKLPTTPRDEKRYFVFVDGKVTLTTEVDRTDMFAYNTKPVDVLAIDKHTYKLLCAMRIRHFEKCIRGESNQTTCFNFLGGVKNGVLSTVVPIKHKLGCMYFSPVEPANFLEPMFELQVNGYIPKVLIRFTLYTLQQSTNSRVVQISMYGNNKEMVILSFGVGGVRAENHLGNMKIELV